jgi:integrase
MRYGKKGKCNTHHFSSVMSRPDQLPKILNGAESEALVSQPNQRYYSPHRDYLYMRLMLKAGLRASEAVSLKPEHVDLMSGNVKERVRRTGRCGSVRSWWPSLRSGWSVAQRPTGCCPPVRVRRSPPPSYGGP